MGRTGLVCVLVLGACGGGAGGTAHGTAKMLNGASPGSAQARAAVIAVPLATGSWRVSPAKISAEITALQFVDAGGTGGGPMVPLSGCTVGFDLLAPGLAHTLDCPFDLPAGTYIGAGPFYGDSFELTIDDAVNGIYTDPTAPAKVTLTAPSGGGQPVNLVNPRAMLGPQISKFGTPFVVNDGDAVTISIVLAGLQSMQVTLPESGQLELGINGNNTPGFPDSVTAIGTPARVNYYVNDALGTVYSYNESALMERNLAISVLYSDSTTAASLDFNTRHLTACPAGGFVFAGKGNGYLGLDANGTLGWAGFSDVGFTMYSAEMRMKQVATVGGTTEFDCLATTTDPMPPGDSFSSGAPTFATPTDTQMMTLLAN